MTVRLNDVTERPEKVKRGTKIGKLVNWPRQREQIVAHSLRAKESENRT